MKVLRGGDGSLTIQVRPGVFPEGLLALVIPLPLWKLLAEGPYPVSELPPMLLAAVIAAAVLSYAAEVSDFTFDPHRGELRWSRRTLYWRDVGRAPLRDILAVTVASRLAGGDEYYLHQTVLSLRGRSLPLTRYFSTGRQSGITAQAIRDFLAARGLPEAAAPPAPRRTAVGFHRDAEGRWVAELDCGHHAHVRHEPPWVDLVTDEGRREALGMTGTCAKCETGAPKDAR